MSNPKISILAVVAMDEGRVIGRENSLPWRIPEDMKRVSSLTTGHTVLMGRKTYESLPPKFRPLPNRRNIVVTRNPDFDPGSDAVEICSDPAAFLKSCRAGTRQIQGNIVWIFGGEEIYRLTRAEWDGVMLTRVKGTHEGDAWFPEFESDFTLVSSEDLGPCLFEEYRRK